MRVLNNSELTFVAGGDNPSMGPYDAPFVMTEKPLGIVPTFGFWGGGIVRGFRFVMSLF